MHGGGLELTLIFLLSAVVAVPLFRRFGLGAVLAYLVAGVVLGPYELRAVRNPEPVLAASEIGVVMLLFVIGLELSPSRLSVMRRPVFGAGGLQVLLCGLALGAIAWLLPFSGWQSALVIGFGLALSSTAVGLQLLAERKTLTSAHGRLAFAILLFQDLVAIPLLAAIPLLGGAQGEGVAWPAILRAVGAIALVVVGGRVLLRHMFRLVARAQMPEVFTASALLAVLGSAWLMDVAGLSMGLGAFLAGVLLADSEFRHELEAQIEPFKGLALGLFFMAVGMSIDVDQVLAEPLTIATGVLLLMAVKFALLLLVGRTAGGLDRGESWLLAAVLALGGEFGFVIFAEAFKAGLLDGPMRDRLVAIIGVSMALTPLLLIAITRLLRAHVPAPRAFDAIPDGHPSVLIAGFGRFGQIVARLLSAQRIPFVAIEHSQEQVEFVRRFGNVVFYGDPAHAELLRSAGAARVKVFVIAIDDAESSVRTVRVVRRHYPDAVVFARARDRRHAWELMDLGAEVVRETFHSSLVLGERVLVALGAGEDAAARDAQRFREHDEALLRSQYLVHEDEQALLQSTRDARRELEQLFGADRGEGVLGGLVRRDAGERKDGERKDGERVPEPGST